jgi:hypothetical protein
LEEQNVLSDVPARQKGSLLGRDGFGKEWGKASHDDLGQQPVVGVEKGDGTVVGNVEGVTLLKQHNQ